MTLAYLYDSNKRKAVAKAGLLDLNLQLTGVVDKVIEGGSSYHGYGIIRLKIIHSSVDYYDPRSKLDFYYCMIKNGRAEIYDHTVGPKVDTVYIDTRREIMSYMEDGSKVEGSIGISTDEGYYDFIKEHTMFK